ncbi:hypothetical protein K1719_036870 [Acacia pycnantha]|nr:hypothetical protein K1719_036870 [Acacia pycnantha]
MRQWGLVVCHHTSARFVPFPLRCTCELLIKAFKLQLNVELQLESVLLEKQVLRTLTVLYDTLLRDSPIGIVTQTPSYPGAVSLGDSVCGMTVAYTTAKDFLFWFRSGAAKEIKWDGAEDFEMNAVHSLQLILQESMKDVEFEHTNSKSFGVDDLIWMAKEMVRLIETAIAPIFSVDVCVKYSQSNALLLWLQSILCP